MNSVLKYCDRAMVLDHGKKIGEGTAKEMVDLYKRTVAGANGTKEGRSIQTMPAGGSWKDNVVINTSALDYGDGRIKITDFGFSMKTEGWRNPSRRATVSPSG